MDLHDYQDVAQNYDHYLSAMVSQQENQEDFLSFYLDLAQQYGAKGIIDIACGTGAVLLHLAEKGYAVDGTDLSEAMVQQARRKADEKDLKLHIFASNMTDFKSSKPYALAIIARSGFMHLTTPELQRKALHNIRENLLPEGILTLNTFVPNPTVQAQQVGTTPDDYTLRVEYINADGRKERIYNAISYHPATQIMFGNWKFETLDENGIVTHTRIRPLQMRQTYQTEMAYLFELCGFSVLDVYGDYDKSPAAGGHLIWVAQKKA